MCERLLLFYKMEARVKEIVSGWGFKTYGFSVRQIQRDGVEAVRVLFSGSVLSLSLSLYLYLSYMYPCVCV